MKNSTAIFFLVLLTMPAEAQQSNQFHIDSLERELAAAREDTNKVNILTDLSYSNTDSHADIAAVYAQQGLDLATKLNFEPGILYAEGCLGLALQIAGNYPLSLDHSFKALSLAKKIKPSLIGWTTSLVSYCYYYLGDYDTFLKYTREGSKLDLDWERPFTWRDLALAYHNLKRPDSALHYGTRAYKKFTGTETEGNISNILGDIYSGKTNYDSALFFYRNGLSASMRNHIAIDLADNYNGIAGVYRATNNFDSATWYAKQVLAEKMEKRYPLALLRAANMLADIYQLENRPDSSLKYLRIALTIKDSLFSREKTNAIQNVAFKEREKQKEVEASELKYQNRLKIYSLLVGLVALLGVAGTLWRNNKNKQKANHLLQLEKEKVESTLSELKATQAQLLQSEKMASLGELTAGIAHEIQNPLNFVNNFSEVNKELIQELKEERNREQGTRNEARENEILNDIEANEEKINQHGKRADAIVKGMLQHSRTSGGQKEATDINALCEEYLRLAYHGLRAKDKSFNATTKTEFDSSIGKINVIPQEIGRVILNLINNAFYAVEEKKKIATETYESIVTVSTKRLSSALGDGGRIEIMVKDNGNGIPGSIKEKIFQPFFTTKPTGQGTGLGLSLAYDIVKAHGGEIKVKTTEGEGSEFIIQLPVT